MRADTRRLDFPWTIIGTLGETLRELAARARADDWVPVLGTFPVDGRVLTTFDDEGAHLYFQVSPSPSPSPPPEEGRA